MAPTFTYSGDPSFSAKDAVRYLVGDTSPDEWFASDEEIEWAVTMWADKNSVFWTASMVAETIAAKFAREVNVSSDSQTVNTSELQQKFMDLAARLRMQHQQLLSGDAIDVGGINAGEQPDPTVTSPAFGTGMHDDPAAGYQDFGDYATAVWNYPWQRGDRGW